MDELRFNVETPLQFTVRVTERYWQIIATTKHPAVAEKINEVQRVLTDPEVVNRSRSDPDVYLFYRLQSSSRWLCAVVKRLNGDGFLITAYPTDSIKVGEQIWQK